MIVARSLPLDLIGLSELSDPIRLPVLEDVLDFVSLPAVLGISSIVGVFAVVADGSDSTVAEFRYESFGTCPGFQSVLLGKEGMAACIVEEI